MTENSQLKVESIAQVISAALAEAIARNAETYRFEDKPMVVVNLIIVEHAGNWYFGNEALKEK